MCWLIGKYIQLVWKTGRWTFTGDEAPRALTKAGEPYIVAFWHGRLLMTPFALGDDRRNICVVISAHRDGQLIARAVNQFNIVTIAGSTSKGGADAFRRAARFSRSSRSDCARMRAECERLGSVSSTGMAPPSSSPRSPTAQMVSRSSCSLSVAAPLTAWP